jgi:hypothetical protein
MEREDEQGANENTVFNIQEIFSLSRQEFVSHLLNSSETLEMTEHYQKKLKPKFRDFVISDANPGKKKLNNAYIKRLIAQES